MEGFCFFNWRKVNRKKEKRGKRTLGTGEAGEKRETEQQTDGDRYKEGWKAEPF